MVHNSIQTFRESAVRDQKSVLDAHNLWSLDGTVLKTISILWGICRHALQQHADIFCMEDLSARPSKTTYRLVPKAWLHSRRVQELNRPGVQTFDWLKSNLGYIIILTTLNPCPLRVYSTTQMTQVLINFEWASEL